jgi:hypothetical protein
MASLFAFQGPMEKVKVDRQQDQTTWTLPRFAKYFINYNNYLCAKWRRQENMAMARFPFCTTIYIHILIYTYIYIHISYNKNYLFLGHKNVTTRGIRIENKKFHYRPNQGLKPLCKMKRWWENMAIAFCNTH